MQRHELTTATVSVKLMLKIITKELDIKVDKSIFWTDSSSVLRHIYHEDKRFSTFLANRISIIYDGLNVGNGDISIQSSILRTMTERKRCTHAYYYFS